MATTDREKIQEVIDITENIFEEKITYISAGALVLTLAFIEKIIPLRDAIGVVILVIGWGLLVVSLLLNLISHLISKHHLNKTILEIDKSNDIDKINSNILKRNKCIDCINWITIVLLILGISCIVIFASINSFQKAYKQNSKDELKISKLQSQYFICNNPQINNYYYYGK